MLPMAFRDRVVYRSSDGFDDGRMMRHVAVAWA